MNTDWINFLKSNNAFFSEEVLQPNTQHLDEQHTLTSVHQLTALQITGTDAATFLQGQLTCDVKELTTEKSFFAAFCSAKGKTITTLLITKTVAGFLLILPSSLVVKVSQKLQMYIMRSDVQLQNMSEKICIIGLNAPLTKALTTTPSNLFSVYQDENIYIKLSQQKNRYLIISPILEAPSLWNNLSDKLACTSSTPSAWIKQDILAGLPWLNQESSEQYIPQMLNIDKLGGISFNKGCYTGQEIIARTHYLGKSKRELFLASCDGSENIVTGMQIINTNNEQIAGKVLSLQGNGQQTVLLIVLKSTDSELTKLILDNPNQSKVTIMDFQ